MPPITIDLSSIRMPTGSDEEMTFRSRWAIHATALVVMIVATIAMAAMTSLAVMFTRLLPIAADRTACPDRLARRPSAPSGTARRNR
jgi:hypothetical protein